MNLALLKKEARETSKRMQDRLELAITENRDLTADEETAQASDQAALDRQLANIKSVEALLETTAAIGADPVAVRLRRRPFPPACSVPGQAALDNGGLRISPSSRQAVRFANPAAGSAVPDGRPQNLAAPSNVHQESGDTPGAYLVPPSTGNRYGPRLRGGERHHPRPHRPVADGVEPRDRARRRDDSVGHLGRYRPIGASKPSR
jgi:hypothetical protein